MTVFIDFTLLSEPATNDALEYIFKSTHDHDKGIWAPHESALIRRLIELFTRRGLDRLEHVKQAIIAWETGVNYKPADAIPTPPGMMARWNADELSLVKLYLESLPPEQWTLDDHMMSVDYVVQRYLPADELATEAEWMATRAGMMGKVQANMAGEATPKQADTILAALPSTVAAATQMFQLTPLEQNTLAFGKMRAVENVRALTDDVRHKMRNVVMRHVEEKVLTGDTSGRSLEGQLLDEFATLNRDWRRIAVTEAGECQLQGFVASVKPFAKVKRVEQYGNACAFCKKIHGRIAEVVPADHPDKDGTTQIWPGKNNIGRSASPRKRVGDDLVARTEDEMWWLPAGLAHPHCRGRWVPVLDEEPGDDPDFAAWLSDLLGGTGEKSE
ncbi:hypothetical protein [Klebsiella pneumoniae]|uniref:hypothetical protein n=1 Tax=Klebsiella pneumoniae TaxID=573 RepID=UPI0034D2A490